MRFASCNFEQSLKLLQKGGEVGLKLKYLRFGSRQRQFGLWMDRFAWELSLRLLILWWYVRLLFGGTLMEGLDVLQVLLDVLGGVVQILIFGQGVVTGHPEWLDPFGDFQFVILAHEVGLLVLDDEFEELAPQVSYKVHNN